VGEKGCEKIRSNGLRRRESKRKCPLEEEEEEEERNFVDSDPPCV